MELLKALPMIFIAAACWACSGTPGQHPAALTSPTATQVSPKAAYPPSGTLPIWSSTNSGVVVIDQSGHATAVGEGTARIEVGTHGHRVTRTVQVTS